MTTEAGLVGEVPKVRVHNVVGSAVAQGEKDKNTEIWGVPDYHGADSPGLTDVERFLSIVKPAFASSVLDAGCGRGVAGLKLIEAGMAVSFLDITRTALDPEVNQKTFIEATLWGRWQGNRFWDYGFCVEVMEHLPTEFTMLAAARLIDACQTTWFQIAFEPDKWGPMVMGKNLHLTVMPFVWWLDRLSALGKIVEARDLLRTGLFLVERSR